MLKSYTFRLFPTRQQAEKLQWTLDRCRELYNACLQERRDAYEVIKHRPDFYDKEARKRAIRAQHVNYYSQANQLPDLKTAREEYRGIHSQVLQDVLRRGDKAFQAFYRRCACGDTPGYPRFQGRDRYDSFCFPQAGFTLTHDNRVTLSKIGSLKIKLHREIKGTIKTCSIKREGAHWYVIFSCEVAAHTLPVSYEDVGIDLGLLHFATLSTGETIENPRYFRQGEKKVEKLQQALARKTRGSHRRHKVKQAVGYAHRKIKNQRADFLHKASRQLVDRYQLIVFEDVQTTNMSKRAKPKQDENGAYLPNGGSAKSGLNKSINDAGWTVFVSMCSYKAEEAGRTLLTINPKYTSQICSGCGTAKKKELSERWHSCECGTELDRDHNAALNILRLGRSLQASNPVEAPAF